MNPSCPGLKAGDYAKLRTPYFEPEGRVTTSKVKMSSNASGSAAPFSITARIAASAPARVRVSKVVLLINLTFSLVLYAFIARRCCLRLLVKARGIYFRFQDCFAGDADRDAPLHYAVRCVI